MDRTNPSLPGSFQAWYKMNMNLAAHNPEFSDGCSITELLSRITTQASQLASRDKKIVDLTSQNVDLTNQNADLTKQIVDLTKQKTEIEGNYSGRG